MPKKRAQRKPKPKALARYKIALREAADHPSRALALATHLSSVGPIGFGVLGLCDLGISAPQALNFRLRVACRSFVCSAMGVRAHHAVAKFAALLLLSHTTCWMLCQSPGDDFGTSFKEAPMGPRTVPPQVMGTENDVTRLGWVQGMLP